MLETKDPPPPIQCVLDPTLSATTNHVQGSDPSKMQTPDLREISPTEETCSTSQVSSASVPLRNIRNQAGSAKLFFGCFLHRLQCERGPAPSCSGPPPAGPHQDEAAERWSVEVLPQRRNGDDHHQTRTVRSPDPVTQYIYSSTALPPTNSFICMSATNKIEITAFWDYIIVLI